MVFMSTAKVTVLIENTSADSAFLSQHGLSIWLEIDGERILIDTGQDNSFIENAKRMNISVDTASKLILTHGHYDHTGGVPALLKTGAKPEVIIHSKAWGERISCPRDAPPHSIGIPWSKSLLDDNNICCMLSDECHRISPNLWCTGTIPNCMGISPIKQFQRRNGDFWQTDNFNDEQAVVISTESGLVIITGCCHSGVINTIIAAQLSTGISHIYAIIGGLHLSNRAEDEIIQMAHDLQSFNIQNYWVNHCTGQKGLDILRNEIGKNVTWAGTGDKFELPALKYPTISQ